MRLLAVVAALLPSAAFAFPIRVDAPASWAFAYTNLQASGPGWNITADPYWSLSGAEGIPRTISYSYADSQTGWDGSAALTISYSSDNQEDFFEARITGTAEAFANVAEGAAEGTRAFAQGRTSIFMYSFSLDAPALYLGTLDLNGGYRNGDVLGAGNYSACFSCFSVNAIAQALSPGEAAYSRVTRRDTVRFTAVPVPEPSVVLLLGTGMLGVALARRRRLRQLA